LVLLTGGQAGDIRQLLSPGRDSPARPGPSRKRPGLLLADNGYACDSTRAAQRRRRIRRVIPERITGRPLATITDKNFRTTART